MIPQPGTRKSDHSQKCTYIRPQSSPVFFRRDTSAGTDRPSTLPLPNGKCRNWIVRLTANHVRKGGSPLQDLQGHRATPWNIQLYAYWRPSMKNIVVIRPMGMDGWLRGLLYVCIGASGAYAHVNSTIRLAYIHIQMSTLIHFPLHREILFNS